MKIDLVRFADDWEALYIDGKLYCDGHEVTAEDVLSAIKDINFKSINWWEDEKVNPKYEDIMNKLGWAPPKDLQELLDYM